MLPSLLPIHHKDPIKKGGDAPSQHITALYTNTRRLYLKLLYLILLGLALVLSACQQAEPPLPTIVSVNTEAVATESPPIEPPHTSTVAPTLAPNTSTPAPEAATATTIPPSVTPNPPTITPQPTNIPLAELTFSLKSVVKGFTRPLYLTHANDQTERLFIIEQVGKIWIVQNGITEPTPFMDITDIVGSQANEQGLLSVAFHPNYVDNGRLFINYTDKNGDTIIARYHVTDDPNLVDIASAEILLTIPQPYGNHNGGHILFGPDGYLYVGMGDGGAANDPHDNGQNLSTLLGKLLRLDVDNAQPYGVPSDNPFVSVEDARPEIWSYGWRNPWRIAFDTFTGDMYIADVGQNQYEELHVELAGTLGGQNYGWRLMEGNHCFNPKSCDPETLEVILPLTEYSHAEGCSITGGYVYRGEQFPNWDGIYLYGDYCTGTVWGVRQEPDGTWSMATLFDSGKTISSFGVDESGELYLLDHRNGEVFQIIEP